MLACLIFLAGLATGVALTLVWVAGDLARLQCLDAVDDIRAQRRQRGESPDA
jgi:hypothetical protein